MERRAFVIARMAVGNDEDALDLVQDAMMKLAQKYAQREEQEWAPLFHRILQSRIRDWYRRQKVRRLWAGWLTTRAGDDGEQEDPIMNVPDPSQRTPENALSGQQQREVLREAIASLPARQQQAFTLRVWEGLDVESTARAMGCSSGSVKTHLSRALDSLRKRLNEQGLTP